MSVKSEREEREREREREREKKKKRKRENKVYYFLLPASYNMVVYILFKVAKNFWQPTPR